MTETRQSHTTSDSPDATDPTLDAAQSLLQLKPLPSLRRAVLRTWLLIPVSVACTTLYFVGVPYGQVPKVYYLMMFSASLIISPGFVALTGQFLPAIWKQMLRTSDLRLLALSFACAVVAWLPMLATLEIYGFYPFNVFVLMLFVPSCNFIVIGVVNALLSRGKPSITVATASTSASVTISVASSANADADGASTAVTTAPLPPVTTAAPSAPSAPSAAAAALTHVLPMNGVRIAPIDVESDPSAARALQVALPADGVRSSPQLQTRAEAQSRWLRKDTMAPVPGMPGNEMSAASATPLTMAKRFQRAVNYSSLGPVSAYVMLGYLVVLAIIPNSPGAQLGLTLAQNTCMQHALFIADFFLSHALRCLRAAVMYGAKEAILNYAEDYMAEPRFKYALLVFYQFMADVLGTFAWASFSVTTYIVLHITWTLSLVSYAWFLSTNGVAFKNWLRTRVLRRGPTKWTAEMRRYHASVCVFIPSYTSILSSLFFLIAVPLMRSETANAGMFPWELLGESVYSRAMIFAAVNIPVQAFGLLLARFCLLHWFGRPQATAAASPAVSPSSRANSNSNTNGTGASVSAAEPETIDPLLNGVRLVDHYCRMTVYFTAIAIGILVGFYCARGNCIYFIYADPSKAFAS